MRLDKYPRSGLTQTVTRNRIPRLSKSRFMSGIQCHKRLYLELYDPDLAGSTDESAQSAFDIGHRVGALARDRYPAGRLIGHDHLHHADAEVATQSALGDPSVPAIYEGAFSFDQVSVRADILTRTRDRRFDLFEVKSTLDVKPEHEWDVALQLYVLEGAGLPVRWARLMHLNRDYVYPGGDYDLKQLFTFTNLTKRARKPRLDIVSALKAIRQALAGKAPPPISTGPHCSKPYACPFHEHCHQGEPDHSIDQLPRLRVRLREQLVSMGILDIRKIPPNFERLSLLQSRVAQAVRTGHRFHDPAVSRKLAKVKFPIHFVDFETFSPALPLYPEHPPLPDDSVSMVRSHSQCRRWSVASRVSAHGPQRPAAPIRQRPARKRRAQRLDYRLRKFRIHATEGVGRIPPRLGAGIRALPQRASSICSRLIRDHIYDPDSMVHSHSSPCSRP